MEVKPPTLAFLLHDVARLLKKRLEQNSRGAGLTRSQWQILAHLAQNEGINQKGLAELLEIEPITLGRIVDKLETLGLIERHPHPTDRCTWLLHLVEAARPNWNGFVSSARSPTGRHWLAFPNTTDSAC